MGRPETRYDNPYESRVSRAFDRAASPLGRMALVVAIGGGLLYVARGGESPLPQDGMLQEGGIIASPAATPESPTLYVLPTPDFSSESVIDGTPTGTSTLEASPED